MRAEEEVQVREKERETKWNEMKRKEKKAAKEDDGKED